MKAQKVSRSKHEFTTCAPGSGPHCRPDGLEKVEGPRFVAKGVQQFEGNGFVREEFCICDKWVRLYVMKTIPEKPFYQRWENRMACAFSWSKG